VRTTINLFRPHLGNSDKGGDEWRLHGFYSISNASVRQAPSQWLRWRRGAEFCSLSTLASVTRYRNGYASVKEPNFAPFSTLASVTRHRNSYAGVREPNFARVCDTAVAIDAPAQGGQFLLPFASYCDGVSQTLALKGSKIRLPDASVAIAMALDGH